MRILKIVTSPRGKRSVSTAMVDTFLYEYQKINGLEIVDTLDVWSIRSRILTPKP
jgi:FMN-dependent NADH-azoreductase